MFPWLEGRGLKTPTTEYAGEKIDCKRVDKSKRPDWMGEQKKTKGTADKSSPKDEDIKR